MQEETHLIPVLSSRPTMRDVAKLANDMSMSVVLSEYRKARAFETSRRQKADLKIFAQYLTAEPPDGCGLDVGDLYMDLSAWDGCDFGLVDGFKRWSVQNGYSVGTINVRLATVKRYCQLATKAGYITPQQLAMIKEVKGYTRKEGNNVDEYREETRKENSKKAQWTHLDKKQADQLKHLDNPRDALLMCLLLDLGLRVGEVNALTVANFDLAAGTLKFYRRKVDKTQTHKLTDDALAAARTYLGGIGAREKLFISQGENDHTVDIEGVRDWATRAMNAHVGVLGKRLGIDTLSPHDCRHYWATRAIQQDTNIKNLQQAGGWNSPYMPLRYAEDNAIANKGVKL